MASGWDIPFQGDLGVQHRVNPVNDKWSMKAVTVTGRLPETDTPGSIPDPGQNQLVPLSVDTFATLDGEVEGSVPFGQFVLPPMDRMAMANAPPQYPVPPVPGTTQPRPPSDPPSPAAHQPDAAPAHSDPAPMRKNSKQPVSRGWWLALVIIPIVIIALLIVLVTTLVAA